MSPSVKVLQPVSQPSALPASALTCAVMTRLSCSVAAQAVAMPDSDAYSPRFGAQIGLAAGLDKFDNATATILFTV